MKKKRVLDLSSVVGDFENDDALHLMELPMKPSSSERQRVNRRTTSRRHSKPSLSSNTPPTAVVETTMATTEERTSSSDTLSPQCVSDDEHVDTASSEQTTKRRLEVHRDKKHKLDSSATTAFFEPISCNKELVDPEFDVWFASSFHILVLSHMVACSQVKEPCARCRLCSPTSSGNSFVCPTVESLQTQLPAMAEHLIHCSDCPPWLRHELKVKAQQQPTSQRLREEYAQCVWGRMQMYSTSNR